MCMIWENYILLIYYGKPLLSRFFLQKTRSRAEPHARKRHMGKFAGLFYRDIRTDYE